MKKGIEPGSEEYQDEGKLFIRVSSLSKYGIEERDQKYLSEELYQKLKNIGRSKWNLQTLKSDIWKQVTVQNIIALFDYLVNSNMLEKCNLGLNPTYLIHESYIKTYKCKNNFKIQLIFIPDEIDIIFKLHSGFSFCNNYYSCNKLFIENINDVLKKECVYEINEYEIYLSNDQFCYKVMNLERLYIRQHKYEERGYKIILSNKTLLFINSKRENFYEKSTLIQSLMLMNNRFDEQLSDIQFGGKISQLLRSLLHLEHIKIIEIAITRPFNHYFKKIQQSNTNDCNIYDVIW